MKPDHVHFKHLYNEQEYHIVIDDESVKNRRSTFINDIPKGPGRILNSRLTDKPFTINEPNMVVTYTIDGIGPGEHFTGGYSEDYEIKEGDTTISGWGRIVSVVFDNVDVTKFYRYIGSDFDRLKRLLNNNAKQKIYSISKNFGISSINMTIS